MVLENKEWLKRISHIDFAFQPIVNIHTGACYGYEALLRNYKSAGFESIDDFFNKAYNEKILYQVDLSLREKVIEKFSRIIENNSAKLFFNLDNRIIDSGDYGFGNTSKILNRYNMPKDRVNFEISEKHDFSNPKKLVGILEAYRAQGFNIAMDDYGVGFSGLEMLYYAEPEYIKIDRFFIQDISKDSKKRLFVSSIINIAHFLGSIVIAEGVETDQEYYTCRELGCDLVQGYLVQYPETDISKLKNYYEHIHLLSSLDRREKSFKEHNLINAEIEYIEPIAVGTDIFEIFEKFRQKKNNTFFPVVNSDNEPMGIIREKSLKDYTYSRYGRELLQNPSFGKKMNKFINKFPTADINMSAENILEVYSHNINIEGVIIVKKMKYTGILSTSALLKVLNEKNLSIARDQNPLSKLPGNNMIYEYISEALQHKDEQYIFVYFDFDNFKPYNDKYGFRSGDRVILLFSDLLKKYAKASHTFIGHIGGDDFFMGVHQSDLEQTFDEVSGLSKKFRKDVKSFYDIESINSGYIISTDREGSIKKFPLLTISAVMVVLPKKRIKTYSPEEISKTIAEFKKVAKMSPEKIYCVNILDIETLFPGDK